MSSQTAQRFNSEGGVLSFLADLLAGIRRVELWYTFALEEIKQRYRRSILGVLWILVSYGMFVGGVSFVFTAFTGEDTSTFILHVAIGFAAYNFIVGNVIDGCQVFISAANWIKSAALPYSAYVYRSIFRSAFTFILQFLGAFAIMVVLGWAPTLLTLAAIPALAIYVLNAVAVQYMLGLVSARFRDVAHLVASITRLLFFVTPILWMREDMAGPRAVLVDFNPLAHYVEILRAPLMNEVPRSLSWIVVLGCTAFLWIAAMLVAAQMRKRLAFWI